MKYGIPCSRCSITGTSSGIIKLWNASEPEALQFLWPSTPWDIQTQYQRTAFSTVAWTIETNTVDALRFSIQSTLSPPITALQNLSDREVYFSYGNSSEAAFTTRGYSGFTGACRSLAVVDSTGNQLMLIRRFYWWKGVEARILSTEYADSVLAIVPWLYGEMNQWEVPAWKQCDCSDTHAYGRRSLGDEDIMYQYS